MTDLIYQGSMGRSRAEEDWLICPDDIDPNTYVLGEPRKDDVPLTEPLNGQEIVGVYRKVREDEPQAITDEGFEHFNDVMGDYHGIKITREFFDEHEQEFVEGVDTLEGFYAEANDGAMSDTLVRDYISTVLARMFTDQAYWPTYGDGPEKADMFHKQYITNAMAKNGVIVSENLQKEYGAANEV